MAVTDLDVYKPQIFESEDGSLIGKCEYFETHIYKLNFTKMSIFATDESFVSVTCVKGEGRIDGEKIALGDTFFIPAGMGEIELSADGECHLITVSVP